MGINSYNVYIAIILVWNLLIWITPLLVMVHSPFAEPLYSFFGLTCHQLPQRSLCTSSSLLISDCSSTSEIQFPVCVRDMAIYAAMLIGGLFMPKLWDTDSRKTPSLLILVAASLPVLLDGGTQLIGFRESNSFLRILTGVTIGLAIPFFLVPLANDLMSVLSMRKSAAKKVRRR